MKMNNEEWQAGASQQWVFLLYEQDLWDYCHYEVMGVYKNAEDADAFLEGLAKENDFVIEWEEDNSHVTLVDEKNEDNRYFFIRAMKLH